MSVSGVTVSQSLVDTFLREAESEAPTFRLIKAEISGEQVVLATTILSSSTEENDFNHVKDILVPKTPSFILFRCSDHPIVHGAPWIFIYFAPDDANVKKKMLYGSSFENTKKSFGTDYFKLIFMRHSIDEINYNNLVSSRDSMHETDAPLTRLEQLSIETTLGEQMIKQESCVATASGSSINFSITTEAQSLIAKFYSSSDITCLKLKIDENEKIDILSIGKESVNDDGGLGQPENMPVYCLFKFSLRNEDKQHIVFAYACPETSKVKQKLIYSASRGNAFSCVMNDSVSIDLKLEVGSLNDINYSYMQEIVCGSSKDEKQSGLVALSRPARPGRRSTGKTPT